VVGTPTIQYLQTPDGVRIAYYSLGSGTPVVVLHPNPCCHLTLEWEVPALRGFYEVLTQRTRLIRLDYRGSGLSERAVERLSPDDIQVDIQAVVERLGLDRFAFLTWGFGSLLALRFALGNPGRVSRFVLAEANAIMADASLNQTVADLRRIDTEVQIKTRANLTTGWDDPENAEALAELIRGSMDAGTFRLWRELIGSSRYPSGLSEITQAVLFLHADADPLFPLSAAQALAATLPNAKMHVIRSAAGIAPFTDAGAVEAAIAFLLDEPGLPSDAQRAESRVLSSREIEVLRLMAAGKTNDEISRSLVISASTVSHHVSNILAKTGTGNRTEAAAYAHREHLVEASE
jgi:pimeloyl-ACP methyl ester carboxylesterase/DNA-binding CsgD family transcriptional regulator